MSLVWLNGVLTDKAEARVSPFDHGLLYGDGVWEHMRLFGGKPFRGAQHLAHLRTAADAVGIELPLSPDELLAAVEATAKANGRTEGYVRVLVTRGPGGIGPDPRKIEPQVLVIAEEYQPFPQELYGHGLHAVVAPVYLTDENVAHRYRTLNQLHVVQAKRHALRNGCLEALLPWSGGYVDSSTEGVVYAVKNGAVVANRVREWDAAGSVVEELAGDRLTIDDEAFQIEPLMRDTDEVFIAGVACGVIGLVRIGGHDIGSGTEGPVTRELRQRFAHLARTESG